MAWSDIWTLYNRPGLLSGRMQPTGWTNPEGDYAWCLGSDIEGHRTLITIGSDNFVGVYAEGNVSDGKTFRVRAHTRGPEQTPKLVRVTSSATANYTVTIDGVDYTYGADSGDGVLLIAHELHQLIVADAACPCYAQINFPGDTLQLDAKDAPMPYTLAVTGNLEKSDTWWTYKISVDEYVDFGPIAGTTQTLRTGRSRERYDTGVMVANVDRLETHTLDMGLHLNASLSNIVADVEVPAVYIDDTKLDQTLLTDFDGCKLWLDGAIGYYPPTNGGNITRLKDFSGNDRDATHGLGTSLSGPAWWENKSPQGQAALTFNGTDEEIYVADHEDLEPGTDSWLFVAYMKFESGGGSAEKAAAGKDTNAGGTGFRCLRTTSKTLQISWGDDTEDYTATTATVEDQDWHLLGWGVDASTNEAIYIIDDTVERKSVTVQSTGVNSNDLTIGGDNTSGLRSDMTLLECAFFKRAATEGFDNTELASLWTYFTTKYPDTPATFKGLLFWHDAAHEISPYGDNIEYWYPMPMVQGYTFSQGTLANRPWHETYYWPQYIKFDADNSDIMTSGVVTGLDGEYTVGMVLSYRGLPTVGTDTAFCNGNGSSNGMMAEVTYSGSALRQQNHPGTGAVTWGTMPLATVESWIMRWLTSGTKADLNLNGANQTQQTLGAQTTPTTASAIGATSAGSQYSDVNLYTFWGYNERKSDAVVARLAAYHARRFGT